jgi:hypothetical protein
MNQPGDSLQAALDDLVAQRDLLDEDITALRRIIARRRGNGQLAASVPAVPPGVDVTRRAAVAAALPGEARREILELMSDGAVWTPSKIAQQRGTTPNAATRALRRMLEESPPPIVKLRGGAKYKLASSKGDGAQGSLSVETERE